MSNYFNHSKYRIKPKEKAFEYKYSKSKNGREIAVSSFFTDAEAKEFLTSYWVKIEPTKRERKL